MVAQLLVSTGPAVLADLGQHLGLSAHLDALSTADPTPVTTTVTVDPSATDDDDIDVDLSDPASVGALVLALLIALLTGGLISLGPGLWVFVGILGSFLVTRLVTRFIRRRSASGQQASGPVKDIVIAGVHIHHQVFGIALMFLTGLIAVITTPPDGWPQAVLALLFGIGVGLAFDEFALWLHLDDVYWTAQGRKSIDAVAVVLVLAASARAVVDFVLTVEALQQDDVTAAWVWPIIAIVVLPAVVCLLKGKWLTAALGFVYAPIGWVGAIRLAKERSWWARHLFGPRRRARAQRRHAGHERRMDRLRDLVGGAITPAAAKAPEPARSEPARSEPALSEPPDDPRPDRS